MQRISLPPRAGWQQKVEAAGLTFHTLENGQPYWDESACYEFSASEIDMLEEAGNTLQEMCLAAAQHVIDEKRYAELGIPEEAVPAIEWAWNNEPPALYGRFDIAYNGEGPPKLLEYNADTPTSLLEAAVIQWQWMEEVFPEADQFNSLHEQLIDKWKDVAPFLSKPIYFAGVESPEDQLTLAYLRDTAEQAGLPTLQMYMEEIGWNDERQAFVDPNEEQMFSVFKLYPWEVMLSEEFGSHALDTYTEMRWIEPIWKLLLSNKGILPILWQLYPNHDLLLESYFDTAAPQAAAASSNGGWQPVILPGAAGDGAASSTPQTRLRDYIRKPLFSREGANLTLVRDGAVVAATDGPYIGPQILQAFAPETIFPGIGGATHYPVLGLWMIDQACSGMGIREASGPITDNLSSFVPHVIR
ncbi:MAG TPA: glutathionylspermidine synthase family protein [Granulicella sp.]